MHLRPLSFGEILDGAFTLYRRHFGVLFATALIPMVPIAALLAVSGSARQAGTVSATAGWLGIGVLLLGPVVGLAGWGALQHQVSAGFLGHPVALHVGLRAGLRSAPSLLVQTVVLGIGWVAFTVLGVIGAGAGALAVGVLGLPGAVLAILIWIGGVGASQLAFFALTFAAPAAVVLERRGPLASLQRSLDLASGALPRTMAVLGVAGTIMLLPTIGVSFVAALVEPTGGATAWSFGIRQALAYLAGALTLPFLAASVTLLYYDRRVRLEALDLELLTARLSPA